MRCIVNLKDKEESRKKENRYTHAVHDPNEKYQNIKATQKYSQVAKNEYKKAMQYIKS
jgi:hypothetical protein